MTLAAGSQLGGYEIVEPIGAGGMGEVYRARDAKLGRDVAIKVLPEELSRDPERVSRFEREAKLLAQLHHANVATLYGLEESDDGRLYLAMELVEGETLADRLARGPIPLDEAVSIFIQIAEGLEAAHEKGIVHRDLKPANVKLTPSDEIKILDFGLAKAFADDAADVDSSLSPTVTRNVTHAGVILGTAAYMSPEQARGKSVDKRSDVWSFGVVLYEAVTGERLFGGETVSDVLAAVLTREIDFDALPPKLRGLAERCLERVPKRRLRDIGEARILLEDPPATSETGDSTSAAASRGSMWLAALLVVTSAAAIAGWMRSDIAPPRQTARLQLELPDDVSGLGHGSPGIAISPDGSLVAFPVDDGGERHLYLYRMETGEAETNPGLHGADRPFFSPNGNWLGYDHDGRLKKVAIAGGEAVTIADTAANFGASWTENDTIVFSPEYNAGLHMVSAGGGDATVLTEPDGSQGELGHWFPQVLPGGEHVLFTNYFAPVERARIEVLSLATGTRKTVVEGGLYGRYVPTGHLVYVNRDALMAVRFDLDRVETEGLPTPAAGGIYANSDGYTAMAFSDNGTLVYAPFETMSPDRQLVWVDRDGNAEPAHDELRRYMHPRLSPDGRRIAVTVEDGISSDVWVLERSSGTLGRVTFGDGADFNPLWSADGRRLYFTSEKTAFTIQATEVDGRTVEPTPIVETRFDTHGTSVSPSGDALLFHGQGEQDGTIAHGVWLLPLDGDGSPRLFAAGGRDAEFSPDGNLIVYTSSESGRTEVYVQAVDGDAGRRQVSAGGGGDPAWSHDGREIFFRDGSLMLAATVEAGAEILAERPRVLFEWEAEYFRAVRNYDVGADGRFLMVDVPDSRERNRLMVVINWFEELQRLVPTEE